MNHSIVEKYYIIMLGKEIHVLILGNLGIIIFSLTIRMSNILIVNVSKKLCITLLLTFFTDKIMHIFTIYSKRNLVSL